MNYETTRALIAAEFAENWKHPNGSPLTIVQPVGLNIAAPADSTWVRFSIEFATRLNSSVGTKFQRMGGIVHLQVYTADGVGQSAAAVLVDKLGEIFENKTITAPTSSDYASGIIRFREVQSGKMGELSGWNVTPGSVAFIADWVKN